jgi:ABC-type phosphate transport system substrate-binding protein
MTTLVRRAVPLAATAVALMAAALPGTALAKKGPKTDQLEHCAGASIEGLGSSFQNPAQKVWNSDFNTSTSTLACSGAKKPTVHYNQEEKPTNNKGSGACLKDFGAGGAGNRRYKAFPLCGTDEAPSKAVKVEMEESDGIAAEEGKNIQSIPVAQGAVAVIVNLPEGCTAESEPTLAKKATKIKRLSLEAKVVEGIYDGTIKTWEQAIKANVSAGDKLSCGAETAAKEKDTIKPVVRLDKSGTTHIFKAFLLQVNTAEFEMEEENEPEGAGKGQPCKAVKPAKEKRTWQQVSEGCENQRWPEAAGVVRPTITGNPGVVKTVEEDPSSIGYADLAVAREKKGFSETGGEGMERFWVPVSDSKPTSKKVEYAEPSTNGDVAAVANSNCVKTVYANAAGEKFPPKFTYEDWSQVKGLSVSKTYPICGLTYMIEFKLWDTPLVSLEPLTTPEEAQAIATTVSNYLVWVLNTKTGGGGEAIKGIDYEPLPKKAQKVAEAGALEIGSKEA